jgi:hypothetical protein
MVGVAIRAHLGWSGILASLPLLAFVAGLVIGLDSAHDFPLKFDEVAAQVIPIVLLVLSFELRVFEYPEGGVFLAVAEPNLRLPALVAAYRRYASYMYLMIVLAALVIGEIIALLCLAYGDPSGKFGQGLILGALLSGFVMIGYSAIVGLGKPTRGKEAG